MQKRLKSELSILFDDVSLPDDFPLIFSKHTQGSQDPNKLHFHKAVEIGICSGGSGLFFVDREIYPFSQDDISFIFSNQPHIAQSSNENPSYWQFITVDLERLFYDFDISHNTSICNILYKDHQIPNIITKDEHKDIYELARLIFNELELKLPDYKDTVKGLMWAFVCKIARLSDIKTVDNKRIDKGNKYEMLSPALNYISTNYNNEITLQKLSQLCHLSVTYFRSIFKTIMGQTPFEYLIQVRTRMASTLLKSTDLPICDISFKVGYQSISSFNRKFKEYYKMSPSDFRKNYR